MTPRMPLPVYAYAMAPMNFLGISTQPHSWPSPFDHLVDVDSDLGIDDPQHICLVPRAKPPSLNQSISHKKAWTDGVLNWPTWS